jgi:3-oxoacyl-[acyl-carrier protein] reductase
MDLGLKDKIALVTGGSKGLGKAIAIELAREGARCERSVREARTTSMRPPKRSDRMGAAYSRLSVDVTRAEDVASAIDETVEQFGGIDVLVNNAGDGWLAHILETSDEDWRYCLEVNLMSAIRFTRGVAHNMRSRGGSYQHVDTRCEDLECIHLRLFDRQGRAADLLEGRVVRTRAVQHLGELHLPRIHQLSLWDKLADSAMPGFDANRQEVFQNLANQIIALKRFGKAKEVAELVAFLASERASFITESVYDIDGGVTRSI